MIKCKQNKRDVLTVMIYTPDKKLGIFGFCMKFKKRARLSIWVQFDLETFECTWLTVRCVCTPPPPPSTPTHTTCYYLAKRWGGVLIHESTNTWIMNNPLHHAVSHFDIMGLRRHLKIISRCSEVATEHCKAPSLRGKPKVWPPRAPFNTARSIWDLSNFDKNKWIYQV